MHIEGHSGEFRSLHLSKYREEIIYTRLPVFRALLSILVWPSERGSLDALRCRTCDFVLRCHVPSHGALARF